MNCEETVHSVLDEERATRISSFVVVSFFAWAGFALNNILTGYPATATVCVIGALVCFLFYAMLHRGVSSRLASHIFLGLNLICICSLSLLTGQSESASSLLLCCFGLFASHMLGLRPAFFWSIVCITCLLAINFDFWVGKLPVYQEHTVLDKTIHCLVLVVIIFALNAQAQKFLNYQTEALVELTESLELKVEEYEKLVQFDTLTHLYNRHSFERHLKKAIERSSKWESKLALLLLDLNGFKQINDTQGHKAGDQILALVAERLTRVLGPDHFIARLGGDEFTIVVENVAGQTQISEFTDQLSDRLAKSYVIDGKETLVGVSVGVAMFPDHAGNPEDLLAFADTAMYEAKNSQTQMVVYRPVMTERLVQRRAIEDQLAEALPNNEFELFYQPQLDVRGNKIVGAEALLRWSKDGKWIPPSEFIGPLESNREIRAVGRWVLKQACEQTRKWHEAGYDINISVNVSSVQFQDPKILDHICEALEESGLKPNQLDIEVTESMLLDDIELTSTSLLDLRELGVSVSIDDFGTGYSSLAYLRELPLTRIKIDRAFIRGIPQKDDGLIAQAVIGLSHSLGLKVLAEGVEDHEQLEFLRNNLCDQYQGFLFSKPLSSVDFEQLLVANQKSGSMQVI